MAFNFPNNPVLNDEHTEFGTTYYWSGVAWRRKAQLVDYVQTAGDTMTGDLTISKVSPVFTLDAHGQQEANRVRGSQNGVMRWEVNVGDTWPETGNNTGSDFEIQRFDDAGTQIDTVLRAKRDTGIVDFEFPPTVQGQPIVGAGNFLPIPGGTMTGPIVLEALAPQSDQDAVPKHYVDALVVVPPPLVWEPVVILPVMTGSNGGPLNNYNYRSRFNPGGFVNDSGDKVRVTLRGSVGQVQVWIGYASTGGDLYDFETTPVQLLFGGATNGQLPGTDANSMGNITTDEGDFFVDPTKSIVVSVKIVTGTVCYMPNGVADANHETFFSSNAPGDQVDAPSNFTDANDTYMLVSVEQGGDGGVAPTPLYLPVAGGTMTGPIILPTATPVAADEAVGRQWVLDQINAAFAAYQLYQGTWQVAANNPDIAAIATRPNGASWRAVTANPAVPETCPPGMPPISGTLIANGDLVVWSQAQQTWGHFTSSGMSTAEADARYLRLGGGTLTGELTFQNDGQGITFNGGGRVYKKSGTGMVVRQPSGNQQLQSEENSGANARNIVDTRGATFAGHVYLPVNNNAPDGRAARADYVSTYYMPKTGGTFTGNVTFNSTVDHRGGDLHISGPTNGNGNTYGIIFRDGGNNTLARIDANRTGYNVNPEAQLRAYNNNGGWGWQESWRVEIASPPRLFVRGNVSADSFTDR
jgi:hypothetical protein